MAKFVLVPGFWLGAWAWDEVAADLRAAGHEVHALTLTGLAEKAALAGPEVNLDTHVGDVDAALAEIDGPVVLVGHSGGGTVATVVADRMPERVAKLVYVDSGPMPGGMSVLDFNEPATRDQILKQVEHDGDGWRMALPPLDPEADPVNLAGLTPEHLATFAERGTPQPFGVASQPLERPEQVPAVPSVMIACTFPVEQVEAMVRGGDPIFGLMADFELRALPTGHWPMFSRPADLAVMLNELAV